MTGFYAPTAIDLSRVPFPDAVQPLSFDEKIAAFLQRFLAQWAAEQLRNPTLPDFTEASSEAHPFIVVARTWALERGLDYQRVNDAFQALLAPRATGTNLENIAASRNLQRLTVVPATATTAAIMESDAALLRRYLESFDAPASGSAGRYLMDARAAWPQSDDRALGLWDARVNGYEVHGRRGDVDVVICGPYGRQATTAELAAVSAAVKHPDRAIEAVSVAVLNALRVEYNVHLRLEVPGIGPAPATVAAEAEKRVRAAATDRILIGAEVPAGLLVGAAYGNGVVRVVDLAPVVIAPDPYTVPVLGNLTIDVETRI